MTRVIDKGDLGVAYRPALSPTAEPVVSTPDGASIANAVDVVCRTFDGEFISRWDVPKVSDYPAVRKAALETVYSFKPKMEWSQWFTKATHSMDIVENMK